MSRKKIDDNQKMDKLLNSIDEQLEVVDIAINLSEDKDANIQNIYFNKINSSNLKILKKIKNNFFRVEEYLDGTLLLNRKITIENRHYWNIIWDEENTLVFNFTNEMLNASFGVLYYFWKHYFQCVLLGDLKNRIKTWDEIVFNIIKIFSIKSGIITRGEAFHEILFPRIEFYVGPCENNMTNLLANILAIGAIALGNKNATIIDKTALLILNKISILNK